MLSGFDRWLIELKRRRVFRVGVLYAAIGIAALEAADVLLDPLGAPAWIQRALVVAFILGLPVALGLAWALEWTGEGIRRTLGTAHAEPGSRRIAALELTGLLVVLGLGIWLAASTLATGQRDAAGHLPPGDASIAVMPFANLSGEPENEYFAAGLTEELLTELSRLRRLRVAARGSTSGAGFSADPREIASSLNVATVLGGTVRRDSSRVIVAAHLDDAEGFQVWAREYSRPLADATAIQDEIAREIADALGLSLLPEERARLNERGTVDVEAYDHYLKGLAELARRNGASLRRAIEHFRRAVEEDPLYAEAHAGLAQANYLLPLFDTAVPGEAMAEHAKDAARRAIELDPGSAEAYAALGGVAYQVDWRMEEAEMALRQAIALSPSYATAHQWLAETQAVQGRSESALASIDRAIALDPTSPVMRLMKGFILYYAGRLDQANEEFQAALQRDPEFGFALYYHVDLLATLGRYDEARNAARRAVSTYFEAPAAGREWLRGVFLYIDAAEDPSRTEEALAYWRENRREPVWRFMALTKLGDVEGALVPLRRMRAEHHPSFVWMPSRLRLDPKLVADPRITAIFREAGLPVLPAVEPARS